MEWTESLKTAVAYMEAHITENFRADDVAEKIHMSTFYFQKGFTILTGMNVGEYIRNRRLYLAALDLTAGREKIIDIAYKYGYETPESFSKAFRRFHGCTPSQAKNDTSKIKVFLPLRIHIEIKGGNDMDFTVEKVEAFKVIGFQREFSMDSSYREIPKFWDAFANQYLIRLFESGPKDAVDKAICDNMVGEYGVCIDDIGGNGKFRYLIAGKYLGGGVPDGMTVFKFPNMNWAKFKAVGPCPGALQAVNTAIFKEWLPGNPDYEIAAGYNIEWYPRGNADAPDYESGIWVPVKHK